MDIKCFADNLGKVDDSFCLAASKPEPIIEMCNVFECAPEYVIFLKKYKKIFKIFTPANKIK